MLTKRLSSQYLVSNEGFFIYIRASGVQLVYILVFLPMLLLFFSHLEVPYEDTRAVLIIVCISLINCAQESSKGRNTLPPFISFDLSLMKHD